MNTYFVTFNMSTHTGNLIYTTDLEIKTENDFKLFENEFKEKLTGECVKKNIETIGVNTVVILNIQKLPIT